MKINKKIIIAILSMCLLVPMNTFADAKDDRIAELERQVAELEMQIAELTSPSTSTNTNQSTTDQSTAQGNTIGETNALRSAKQYLEFTHFSAEGLKKQLKYEGYSDSEADFAVANCGANWNEQASESAKQYMELMPMSRDQLYNQLIYEGFTDMQALIGCGAVGY